MATGQSVRIALVNQIRTRTGVSIVAMNICSITYIQPQNQELSFRPARRPKDGRQDFPPLKGRLVLETTQGYLGRFGNDSGMAGPNTLKAQKISSCTVISHLLHSRPSHALIPHSRPGYGLTWILPKTNPHSKQSTSANRMAILWCWVRPRYA